MPLSPDRLSSLRQYLERHFIEEPAASVRLEGALFGETRQSSALEVESKSAADRFRTPQKKSRKKKDSVETDFKARSRSLEDIVANPEETFSRSLFRLIREGNLDEVTVYKRAGIDRKHFSKIRSNDNYNPKKPTVLSLAIALELNLDETLDLLGKAGYTLSHSSRTDLIVEYFINDESWDLFEINDALSAFDQPLLSAG